MNEVNLFCVQCRSGVSVSDIFKIQISKIIIAHILCGLTLKVQERKPEGTVILFCFTCADVTHSPSAEI